ncbi:HD-GYP domain-containing protein [Oceanicoccus sp. KOV_DT_Chl]|uniref:HD-GYP domain-containing protein n=1 Tax=Oceanicoccus sp. KOV_DT_Chl TaxID=1904639 RepID=UPI001F316729|nr:HD-GYP domain-containing protein [Oceanicoccus sp. KOV_DT_Chl]
MSNDTVLKISCDRLSLGMKVVELDRPWVESPFTVHGFRITTEAEISKLKASCKYVYVAAKAKKTEISAKNLKRQAYNNTQSFQQALPQAKSAHRQAKSVVKGFFKNLELGQTFETSVAKKAVKQCVDSVIANQEAMMWLGLLKDVDEYTARHSLNVGLLSIILGRAEGLSPADLEVVGLCGMLHDMGKSKIPLEILNKEGAFSEEEFDIMKTHTTLGYEILTAKSDITDEVANVAYSHHERLNGRGYPRALPAEKISYFSRIVAIADTYDAITSKRVYSPAKTSLEGLRILIGAKGSHYDPILVDRFVEAIGIYPAGSVAEMSNGEIGLILPSAIEHRNSPKVLIVRGKDKKPCDERQIDLSQEPTDANGKLLKINHLLSDDAFGIDLKKYHELGTAEAG